MIRFILVVLCVAALAGTAAAQTAVYVFTALGMQTLSVTSTAAVQLTVPNGARVAQICTDSNAVRYREDTTPTATVGMPVAANTCFQYSGALTTQSNTNVISPTQIIEFIAVSTTATLSVDYYR